MASDTPIIRSLASDDLSDVLRIAEESQHNSWTQKVFEDCLKAEYVCSVLLIDDQVVGFVVGLCHGAECQLMNLGVANAYHRRGFARQLLLHLIAVARSRQVVHMSLEVRASNMAAIRLYESLGFVLVGERQCYYPAESGRENALIFFLNI